MIDLEVYKMGITEKEFGNADGGRKVTMKIGRAHV